MQQKQWLPLLALTMVSLIYGANFSIAKIPMEKEVIQPLGFIFLRALSGAIFFWTIWIIWIRERIQRNDIKWLIVCGLAGVAINQSLFFLGLKYTNPINGALVMTLTPIIVLILSRIILKEQITLFKILGISLGISGAVLLILKGINGFEWSNIKGDIFVLLNAISFSFFLIYVKKVIPKYHPFTVLSWIFLIGFICLIPVGGPAFLETEWTKMNQVDFLSIGFVLFFTTCMTYLLNTWAVGQVKPTVVSSFIYLQPLFAGIIAIFLKTDVLSQRMLFAGTIIFLGVYIISKKN